MLDADRLGHGDLHMVDPVAVPDRLEQPVGEAEGHDVLHRLLAEEVVDAEDLLLAQLAADAGVQLARRVDAVAERLLDHHASPALRLAVAQLLVQQAGMAELLDDGAEEPVGHREIEQAIAAGLPLARDVVQVQPQLLEQAAVAEVALHIGHAAGQTLPHRIVDRVDAVLAVRVADEALQHRRAGCRASPRALRSVMSTPMMAKCSGMRPVRARLYNAGTSRRRVRSPLAPKITIAHGPGGGAAVAARRREPVRWAHPVGFLSWCSVQRSVQYRRNCETRAAFTHSQPD